MENGSPDLQLNKFAFRELTLGKARRNIRWLWFIFSVYLLAVCHWNAFGQSQYQSSTDFAKFAVKLRESGLLSFESKSGNTVGFTMAGRGLAFSGELGRGPWKTGIATTIFWIGERPTINNPVSNDRSS